ncbi:MAG: hypothetical protein WC758_06150 [Candidatus Woesearchaeota archaeon]|jgi:hypothetical protein
MFRILSVNSASLKGKKVKVKYYDTETLEVHVKEDEWDFITPTREIILEKYNYTADSLIDALKNKFSGEFILKDYGRPSNSQGNNYGDREIYKWGQESVIIWHLGNREDKKDLEFYIDDENKKQIFIRNGKKRFLARTRILEDENQIERAKTYLESTLPSMGFDAEDITISERGYVQVKCTQTQLKLLDASYFRINSYISADFDKLKNVETQFSKIQTLDGARTYIDQLKIITKRCPDRKIRHYIKLTTDSRQEFIDKLIKEGMTLEMRNRKNVLSAKEELWDPLMLNSSASQLRDFFPTHSMYDPNIILKLQMNTKPFAFSHLLKEGKSELEIAINDAYNFYNLKSAIIDLEVVDYDKTNKTPGSGRIFMAVLYAAVQKKLYITKEVWQNDEMCEILSKQTRGADLVFVEDEIHLIANLAKDTAQYEFIIGHNFRDYDQAHLSKFNDENELFKQEKISEDTKKRIKDIRKENKTSRLWPKTKQQILDTYHYTNHRIDLFADHKLSTLAGFTKSISYVEMDNLLKLGTCESIQKIINYTIEDGVETEKMVKTLLFNAVLESFATNSQIQSTFSSDPIKKFYDAGQRHYFMQMKTYKNRHEESPHRHFEKLDARESPEEILSELFKNEKKARGIVRGKLYFPSVVIDSFKDIIDASPYTKFIYERMMQEKNPALKSDLLDKLHSALLVPFDKIKKYMESAKLEFGKEYALEDLYKSYNLDTSEIMNEYFDSGDFEKSRTSYIFCVEYGARRKVFDRSHLPFDVTMLEHNNIFAKKLEEMKKKGFDAKSERYYLSKNNIGFELGPITAVKFKENRMAGRLDGLDIYLNMRKPEDKLILEVLDATLKFNETKKEELYVKILAKGYDYWVANRDYISHMFGVDPVKTSGSFKLF